jgi:hypothetical protein
MLHPSNSVLSKKKKSKAIPITGLGGLYIPEVTFNAIIIGT